MTQKQTTTHTPGPWDFSLRNNKYGIYAPADGRVSAWPERDPWRIAWCLHGRCPEAEANARLIAAAPDLLDILDAAVKRIELANAEGNPILSAWLPDARAAIAKAQGKGV